MRSIRGFPEFPVDPYYELLAWFMIHVHCSMHAYIQCSYKLHGNSFFLITKLLASSLVCSIRVSYADHEMVLNLCSQLPLAVTIRSEPGCISSLGATI